MPRKRASSRRRSVLMLAFLTCLVAALPLLARSGKSEARDAQKAQAKPAKQQAKKAKVAKGKEIPEQTLVSQEPGRRTPDGAGGDQIAPSVADGGERPEGKSPKPREHRMQRGRTWDGDLRDLPRTRPARRERPEREGPTPAPRIHPGGPLGAAEAPASAPIAESNAPAPEATVNFDGLDFANWGAGHPPDPNGDVGPQHYIESINTSVGIFDKSDGSMVTAFTFNTLMAQGAFGNVCDTNNFGDPVVLYDTFEDRWVITDFAFRLSGGNVLPPALQCFAVSKSGDPVSGGWNFYFVETLGGLGDYPKVAVWPDGIYMSVNMFGYAAGASFQTARVWAFNKAQMYAGAPSAQAITFDVPGGDFSLLPSNARLQTGTPPAGTPNYFLSTWQFLNALTVYKFHADWDKISLSTFTGPDIPLTGSSWPNAAVPNAPSLGGNSLDVLQIRAMMQNQYSNIGGVESLWATHTVRRANTTGFAAPRWYQVNVTGGSVASPTLQAATWDPDAANVMHRFMPSLAVNRNGDMALGYSTSNSTTKPAVKYAGRLAGDPLNTFSQTETVLVQGAGTQTGNCGSSTCTRWGDYSAMTLDVDGCTFWYANMYYKVDGLDHQTRIGAFALPGCDPVGNGTLSGTVEDSGSGNPIAGATVALGSRTTTTDASGAYSFSVPAGTYPGVTASFPGFGAQTFGGIAVAAGATTTQDFALGAAPAGGCFTDTTQPDFQFGIPANCDLNGSPGDVTLLNTPSVDQQNTTLGGFGVGINVTTWGGQTFTAALSGPLVKADVNLFCSGCTGTTPSLTLSLRATSGGVPTGADIASATIPGFSSGASGYHTATFATPPTLTAGTQYALVVRPTANPSAGTYALTRSGAQTLGADVYAGGTRVAGATSGTVWTIPTTGGVTTDAGFRTYVQTGFQSPGTFVSGAKDANPVVPGAIVNWATLSWNAVTPAGTAVQFQAAAGNSPFGPFDFVGPDGTGATFFANGGSLAQFTGKRYLKYRVSLTTTDPAATPLLNDVTVCYGNVPSGTDLAVDAATGVYGGTAELSAKLSSGGSGVGGKTVGFTLNGAAAGSAVTDASGTASLSGVSLAGIGGGSYPGGVAASFAGDAGYAAASGSNTLLVQRASQTIDFGPLANKAFGDPDFPVSATATSGLPVGFSASGACTVSGAIVHITGGGSCTITASQGGDADYEPAPDVPRTFSIGQAMLTVTALDAEKTYGEANPPFGVSYSGFVGGDGPGSLGGSLTFTTPASVDSPVGSYPVTPGGLTSANYTIVFVDGALTVKRAPLTITADDASRPEGAPNPPFAATFAGLVAGDTPADLTGTLVFTTPATPASPPGTYPITPSGLTSPNYTIAYANGTLTVLTGPDGRMNGNGFVADGGKHHHFTFRVSQGNKKKEDARLEFWVHETGKGPASDDDFDKDRSRGADDKDYRKDHKNPPSRFEATAFSEAAFSDDPGFTPGKGKKQPTVDTVLFAGSGTWNGQAGYAFEATASDQGEPGKNRDTFAITIRNAAGMIVAQVQGSLGGGNVDSTRLKK